MGNAWCGGDKLPPGNRRVRGVRAPVWLNEELADVEAAAGWGATPSCSAVEQDLPGPEAGAAAGDAPEPRRREGGACGPPRRSSPSRPSGPLGRCCTARVVSPEPDGTDLPEGEEVIDTLQLKNSATRRAHAPAAARGTIDTTDVALSQAGDKGEAHDTSHEAEHALKGGRGIKWDRWRPVLMALAMIATVVAASFVPSNGDGESQSVPSLESMLRYGSIPVIAAIIGYGTNVVALQMMFYPLEFVGCFPHLKIGCGLDLPLCGWQGVIPMKAADMATMCVELLTRKLISIEEIFSRLNPERVAEEVADMMPDVVSSVINEAGRRHCPKLWEHMPARVRKQLEDGVLAESGVMMASFIRELQKNITDAFDLKACVVDVMVDDRTILNDTFLLCGAEEFEFIKVSGFYLGFFFGLFQMLVWMFVKSWWILPLCGVLVGYFTNVVALKVIFLPIEPRTICRGVTVQGLFLQRQHEVSALYGKQVAERVLSAPVLLNALVTGPKSDKMFTLVDKHVSACMEDQAGYYKSMFLLSIGSETWIDFRGGVCNEFRKRLPALLTKIRGYVQETLEIEDTLCARLRNLPPAEFERLLHAVFEQDEFKLILVGAILGALVGFAQALVQTPEQLGLG